MVRKIIAAKADQPQKGPNHQDKKIKTFLPHRTMTTTTPINVESLFRVNGIVALITGGGTGASPRLLPPARRN